MAVGQRLHRIEPKRDKPIRGGKNEGPAPGAQAWRARPTPAPALEEEPPPPQSPPGVASSAVATAYEVISENVREGRLAAERLHAAARPPDQEPPSAKDVANRLMHMYRELAMTSADLIAALVREAEAKSQGDPWASHRRHAAGHGAATAAGTPSITQRVRSRKAVEVTITPLPPLPPGVALTAPGLHALSPGRPPISNVVLMVRPDGGLDIDIFVPDDQPAGVYAGVVLDDRSHHPLGSLTVRVLE